MKTTAAGIHIYVYVKYCVTILKYKVKKKNCYPELPIY